MQVFVSGLQNPSMQSVPSPEVPAQDCPTTGSSTHLLAEPQ
jgi:hypothetical protein